MRHRGCCLRRRLRWCLWTTGAATALCFVLMLSCVWCSMRGVVWIDYERSCGAQVHWGRVGVFYVDRNHGPFHLVRESRESGVTVERFGYRGWRWWPGVNWSNRQKSIEVPLWIPGVIGVVVMARTTRRLAGLRGSVCAHCGYPLVGLTTSVCPECGRPFPSSEQGRHSTVSGGESR